MKQNENTEITDIVNRIISDYDDDRTVNRTADKVYKNKKII